MSEIGTKTMGETYTRNFLPPLGFLSGLFKVPQIGGFFDSETLELHARTGIGDAATPVESVYGEGNSSNLGTFSVKNIAPAEYNETFSIGADRLLKAGFGETAYTTPNAAARVNMLVMEEMNAKDAMLRRALELQAAQWLTAGQLTLKAKDGTTQYTLGSTYRKSALYPTAATAWGATGCTIEKNVNDLATLVLESSYQQPDMLIMDIASWLAFKNDAAIMKQLDIRNLSVGGLTAKASNGQGGMFMGTLNMGGFNLDIWVYSGYYQDRTNSLAVTRYVPTGKAIVLASQARRDAYFGNCPLIADPERRVLDFLPRSYNESKANLSRTFINAWIERNKSLTAEVMAKQLLFPMEAYGHGCLTTGAT